MSYQSLTVNSHGIFGIFDHHVIAKVELWDEARAEKALAAAYGLFNRPKKAFALPERIAILKFRG